MYAVGLINISYDLILTKTIFTDTTYLKLNPRSFLSEGEKQKPLYRNI